MLPCITRSIFFFNPVLSLFFRELAELHKVNASRASEAEEAALSRDVQAKEQLTFALEKVQEEARIQQEALVDQVTPPRPKQSINLECIGGI